MGITVLTAMIIQTNGPDIKPSWYQDKDTKKYGGVIEHWRDDRLHQVLVSTNAAYDSEEQAIKVMEDVITAVREADESPTRKIESPDGGAS